MNALYGNPADPNEAGSGGSAYNNNRSNLGGNGGGLARIKAGAINLNGGILADGMSVVSGGGSGGGIRIDAGTLYGSGAISAKGGASTGGYGAGGGGRIAVYYNIMNLPVANVTATGGLSNKGATAAYNGGAGTVELSPVY